MALRDLGPYAWELEAGRYPSSKAAASPFADLAKLGNETHV
jgi:hypothetical protein